MPNANDGARYALIPWPRSLEPRPGEFLFGAGTRAALVPDGDQTLRSLGATLGLPLDGDAGAAGTLTLTLDRVLPRARSRTGSRSRPSRRSSAPRRRST